MLGERESKGKGGQPRGGNIAYFHASLFSLIEVIAMKCPYCKGNKIRMLNFNFPQAYECLKCKKVFSAPSPALM